jgi:peptide/nickel transport system permease protein
MAIGLDLEPRPPEEEPPVEQWQTELQRVGILRRILHGRKWYGADWWFVVISSLMVIGFIILAIAPGLFAPNDPREQVGPRFLAPGEAPDQEILVIASGSGVTSLADLPTDGRQPVGVLEGAPSSEAARDEAERLTAELAAAGSDERVRLAISRYDTLPETLDALVAGEVLVVAASSQAAEEIIADYPTLELGNPVSLEEGATVGSFPLGTNQIGQDVLSRLIWGTRIALIIGFSASIFSLIVGVPLGLFAGFTGGKLDRGLTLIMDSLYAFPGLILAIAITAVLGPSIFNVIVAIAVLYIPTYYRIVRGQTLSAKEELYVEAAKSLGAKARVILRRYIYPNVIPSVAIIFSVNVADAILTGAALSFLGLGLPPTTPDWGIDLARGQETIQRAWWLITFPGFAVMLVVLAFTMMGEGLMEIFNPKLRER